MYPTNHYNIIPQKLVSEPIYTVPHVIHQSPQLPSMILHHPPMYDGGSVMSNQYYSSPQNTSLYTGHPQVYRNSFHSENENKSRDHLLNQSRESKDKDDSYSLEGPAGELLSKIEKQKNIMNEIIKERMKKIENSIERRKKVPGFDQYLLKSQLNTNEHDYKPSNSNQNSPSKNADNKRADISHHIAEGIISSLHHIESKMKSVDTIENHHREGEGFERTKKEKSSEEKPKLGGSPQRLDDSGFSDSSKKVIRELNDEKKQLLENLKQQNELLMTLHKNFKQTREERSQFERRVKELESVTSDVKQSDDWKELNHKYNILKSENEKLHSDNHSMSTKLSSLILELSKVAEEKKSFEKSSGLTKEKERNFKAQIAGLEETLKQITFEKNEREKTYEQRISNLMVELDRSAQLYADLSNKARNPPPRDSYRETIENLNIRLAHYEEEIRLRDVKIAEQTEALIAGAAFQTFSRPEEVYYVEGRTERKERVVSATLDTENRRASEDREKVQVLEESFRSLNLELAKLRQKLDEKERILNERRGSSEEKGKKYEALNTKYRELQKNLDLALNGENEAKKQLLQQSISNQSELNGLYVRIRNLESDSKTQKEELTKALIREKELINQHNLDVEVIKQKASESMSGLGKKIESEKIIILEKELSDTMVRQTNLRELAIKEKNLEIENLRNAIESLKSDIIRESAKANEAGEKLTEESMKSQGLEVKVRALQSIIYLKNPDAEALKNFNPNQGELEYKREIDGLKQSLYQSQEEKKSLETQLASLREFKDECLQLRENTPKLNQQIKDGLKKIEELLQNDKSHAANISRQKEEIAKLEERNSSLVESNRAMESSQQENKKKIARLENSESDLKNEITAAQELLRAGNEEKRRLSDKVYELEQEKVKLQESIKSLENQEKSKSFYKRMQKIHSEIETEEQKQHVQAISKISTERDQLLVEKTELMDKVHDLNSKNQELSERMNELSRTHEESMIAHEVFAVNRDDEPILKDEDFIEHVTNPEILRLQNIISSFQEDESKLKVLLSQERNNAEQIAHERNQLKEQKGILLEENERLVSIKGSLQDEIKNLRIETEKLVAEKLGLETDLENLKESLRKLEETERRNESEMSLHREERNRLKEERNQLQDLNGKLTEDLNKLFEEKTKASHQEKARFAEEKNKLATEIVKLADENSKLVQDKINTNEHMGQLNKEIASLNEEIRIISDEKAKVAESKAKLLEEKARIADEKNLLVKEKNEWNKSKSNLIEEKTKIFEEKNAVAQENAFLKQERDKLIQEMSASLSAKSEEILKENINLKNEISEMKISAQRRKATQKQIEADNQQLKTLLDEQKSQNNLLSTELTKLSEVKDMRETEVTQINKALIDRERAFDNEKKALLNDLSSQKEKFLSQINQSQEHIILLSKLREKGENEWSTERNSLVAEADRLLVIIRGNEEKIANLSDQLLYLTDQLANRATQYKNISDQLSSVQIEIDLKKSLLEESVAKEKSLTLRIKELEGALSTERLNRDEESRKLLGQIDILNKKVVSLEKNLQIEGQALIAEREAKEKAEKKMKDLNIEVQDIDERRKNFERDINYSKAAMENELVSLKINNEKNEKKVADLEKSLSDVTAELSRSQKLVHDKDTLVSNLAKKSSEYTNQLKTQEKNTARLKEELATTQQRLAEKEMGFEELSKNFTNISKELESQKEQNKKHVAAIEQTLSSQILSKEKEIQNLRIERDQEARDKKRLEQSVEEQEKELAQLREINLRNSETFSRPPQEDEPQERPSSGADILAQEIAKLEERRVSELAREKKFHLEEVESLRKELDEQHQFITDLRENVDLIKREFENEKLEMHKSFDQKLIHVAEEHNNEKNRLNEIITAKNLELKRLTETITVTLNEIDDKMAAREKKFDDDTNAFNLEVQRIKKEKESLFSEIEEKHQTITSLRLSLSELEASGKSLRESLSSAQSDVNERQRLLESDRQQYQKELKSLEFKFDNIKQELQEAISQNKMLSELLEAKNNENLINTNQLKNQLEKSETNLRETASAKDRLESELRLKIQKLESEMSSQSSNSKQNKEIYEKFKAEVLESQREKDERIKKLEGDNDRLKKDSIERNEFFSNKIKESQNKIESLEEEKLHLGNELNQNKSMLNIKSNDFDSLNQESSHTKEKLKSELASLRKSYDAMVFENESSQKFVAQLSSASSQLVKEKEGLHEEKGELEKRLQGLKDELEALKKDHSQLSEEKDAANEEKSLLVWEREDALQKLQIFTKDNERLTKEKAFMKDNFNQEREKLIAERDGVRSKLVSATKEVEYSEKQLADERLRFQETSDSSDKQITDLKKMIHDHETEIKNHLQTIGSLKNTIGVQTEEYAKLNNQHLHLLENTKTLEIQIKEVKEQLDKLKVQEQAEKSLIEELNHHEKEHIHEIETIKNGYELQLKKLTIKYEKLRMRLQKYNEKEAEEFAIPHTELIHDLESINRHDDTNSGWHSPGMFHHSPLEKSLADVPEPQHLHHQHHQNEGPLLPMNLDKKLDDNEARGDSRLDQSMHSFISDGGTRRSVEETKQKMKLLKQMTGGAAAMMNMRNNFNYNTTFQNLREFSDSKEKMEDSFTSTDNKLTQSTFVEGDKSQNVRRTPGSKDKK